MRKLCFLFVCLAAVTQVTAQTNRANYKQAQKFQELVSKFGNDLTVTPQFINDSDIFWYSYKTSDGIKFYIVNPAKKEKKNIFNIEKILTQIGTKSKEAHDVKKFQPSNLSFDKKIENVTFNFDGNRYSYNLKSGKITTLSKESAKIYKPSGHNYSPDSCYVLYAYKNNLYVYGNKDKGMDTTVIQLTTDGTDHCSYAKYPDESQKQHTGAKGRWMKNSITYMVIKEDESKLGEMYVVDMIEQPRPTLKSYKYPMPGDSAVVQYSMELFNVKTKQLTHVNADKWKDQSLSYVFDNRASDKIFFYRSKRTCDERELCVYDVKDAAVKVLWSHVEKPYIDYQIDQTHFIGDGAEFITRTEESGYGHFYLHDGKTGKRKNAITSGSYVTGQMVKIDSARREMYYYGFGCNEGVDPYYYTLCRANLDSGKFEILTSEDANHKAVLSPSMNYFVNNYSRVDLNPSSVLKDKKGNVIMELEKADLKMMYDMGWRKPERFKVKAADGITDLYGVMWKPMDFDSTKTYPIISDVYPGPHYEYVPTSFILKDSHASEIAQLGFIVIQVGHRGGTPIRGKFYQRYGYGKLRDYPLADDKEAITQLAARYKFIDGGKVGIYGHSGGGFMSVAALCTYPDFYTAAVASAGNHDNRIYNNGWIEVNNGIDEVVGKDSTVGFKAKPIQTNMDLAKNYKGHLLLVHGLLDDNVNPAHTMRMAKALMDAGKNFDMILLPKSKHGFVGEEDPFFVHKMWRHFAKYLLNDASGDYNYEIKKY